MKKKNMWQVSKDMPKIAVLLGAGFLLGIILTSFLGESSDKSGLQTGLGVLAAQESSLQKSPSSCTSALAAACNNAYANGGLSATYASNTGGNYSGFGYALANNRVINSVIVRTDAFANFGKNTGSLRLKVSSDNGVTWGPLHKVNLTTREVGYNFDVSRDKAWTPENLANLMVSTSCYSNTGDAVNCKLDWVQVTVRYR